LRYMTASEVMNKAALHWTIQSHQAGNLGADSRCAHLLQSPEMMAGITHKH